ncbi:MAG: adenylate/guanylate cyclase domain-containing protein, partial [Campylobacterales bacterium]|nr:adenylate/guanylate cyclase domain-containing protein [Campylobacterales bacterium]
LFVNYRGPSKTFPYYSAVDLYNGNFDPKDVEGKFMLFGTSAAGLLDLRAMPFDSVYPGVEIHANIIDNILAGDFISKPSWIVAADLLMIIAIPVILSLVFAFASALVSLTVLLAGTFGAAYFNYYMLFNEGLIYNNLFPLSGIILTFIVSIVINYFLETKQKNMIKGKFATKVSPAVMEELVKNPDNDVFAAMEKEITVFFSDVRNFTNISEAMGNPKNLIDFMNEYMDPMTDIIIETGGTIDKFIGDAIMAYWNAPADVDGHADKAMVATLNQLHRVTSMNVEMRKDPRFKPVVDMSDRLGLPIVDIGIGLNTGVAIVGEMGSSSRADYTVIGDPVNLGARLESLCKYYNSKCNISNFTKEQLEGDYIYRFLDLVTVKGKSEPIEIWQVHDYEDGRDGKYLFDVTRERLQEELDEYNRAIGLYKEAKFEEALALFKDINSWEDKTNKNVYNMYIERCEHYIEVPPAMPFDGVFKHTTKG